MLPSRCKACIFVCHQFKIDIMRKFIHAAAFIIWLPLMIFLCGEPDMDSEPLFSEKVSLWVFGIYVVLLLGLPFIWSGAYQGRKK